MPFEPIPFTSMDLSADKATEQQSYSQLQYDGYFKKYFSPDGPKMIWCKRPGLASWSDTTESVGIWDLFYAVKADMLIAVTRTQGDVYKIALSTGTATDITGTYAMDGGFRPGFVEGPGGGNVYLATGEKIGQYPTASGTGAELSDADAPTAVISIAALNNVLIGAREDSKRFDWSDAGAFTTWTGQYASAESTPGYIRRIAALNNYLYIFKYDTIEVWRDDGSTFIRESQGSINTTCRWLSSIKAIGDSFYFVDSDFQIVKVTGFEHQVISHPYVTGIIAAVTDYEKFEGHHLRWDGKDFYILQFYGSSSNVPCLVYDIQLNQWYRWCSYSAGTYYRWNVSGIVTANNGIWYAGCFDDGLVYKISGTQDISTDIYSRLRTDFVDRGAPEQYKYCHELVLLMKRSATATTAKTISLRYRDDGTQTWSTAVTASIEAASTTELKVNFRRLGRYKRRQWEFLISDATVASLVSAWERFSVGT